MNKQKISFSLGLGAAVMILGAAIVQAAAIPLAFDKGGHYFAIHSPLPLIASLLALFGGALGIGASVLADKQTLSPTPFSPPLSSLPSAVGFAVGGIAVLLSAPSSLGKLAGILLLFSALYALTFSFGSQSEEKKKSFAALGAAPVLAFALLNAHLYFDVTVEMNAPIKVTAQTALLFAMLTYTGEIRFLLGRAMPRLYLSLAFCTLAASALCALPFSLSYLLGLTDRLDYAGIAFMLGLISVTLIARILSLLPLKKKSFDAPLDAPEENSLDYAEQEDNEAL